MPSCDLWPEFGPAEEQSARGVKFLPGCETNGPKPFQLFGYLQEGVSSLSPEVCEQQLAFTYNRDELVDLAPGTFPALEVHEVSEGAADGRPEGLPLPSASVLADGGSWAPRRAPC